MESIKVFAPATVANVGCGFDIFGLAVDYPGDEVILKKRDDEKIVIQEITGDGGRLSLDASQNAVSVPIIQYLAHLNLKQGFDIILNKKMALGSGLGSSSASSVAGVFAANKILGEPLSQRDLLPFAMEGERVACGSAHADNVAPALLGGFVVIRSYHPLDVFKVNTPDDLWVSLIHPDVEVNTKDARYILKSEVSLKKTIAQMGNVAGMIAGLTHSDYELIGRSMEDLIIEPVRSILIPQFFEVKSAAIEAGALGCSISGAGPSIFAFSKGKSTAETVASVMQQQFKQADISSETFVSALNTVGPKVVG